MGGLRASPLLILLFCGCGLSDYEKRMDEQRERLARLDEEERLLGERIDLPKGKDAYGNDIKLPFRFTLRLPKEVSRTFRGKEAIYYGDKLPLYRFFGKGDLNVFIAVAGIPDKNAVIKEKDRDEATPEEFAVKVRSGLQDFIRREYSLNDNLPDFTQTKKDPRETVRDNRPFTLKLDSLSFDTQRPQSLNRFFVFFHQTGYRQAAVIYQVPQGLVPDQTFQRAIDYSIKSLNLLKG